MAFFINLGDADGWEWGKRAMIVLRRFTRPNFDDAMVVRSNDWAFACQVDFGGVLGPCCLRGDGVAGHGEKRNVKRSSIYFRAP